MNIRERLKTIQWRDALTVVGALLLSGLIIYTLVTTASSHERIRQQYTALDQHYAELYEEAVVAGAEPDAPPPEDVPEPDDSAPELPLPEPQPAATGAQGERGPGPTQAQVIQALSTYCARNDCVPVPTVSQVAAAIADYCSDGACRGEEGKRGKTGANGTDGNDGSNGANGSDGQNGEPGRPPTAEEIANAVAAYCSGGSCRGEDGSDGKPGPPPTDQQVLDQVEVYCAANNDCQGRTGDTGATGATGVGIADVECPDDENDDWVYTFTDGSQKIVAGPCRVGGGPPIIDPPSNE
jgi:hypothetical protein